MRIKEIFFWVFLTLIISLNFPNFCSGQINVTFPLDSTENHVLKIHKIFGANSNLKLNVLLENLTDKKVEFRMPAGIAILPQDENTQSMVTVHEQVFEIPPLTTGKLDLQALCLEAWKNPPSSLDAEGMIIVDSLISDDVAQFIVAMKKVEKAIANSIYSISGEKLRFKVTTEPELINLAQYCHYHLDENEQLKAELDEMIVQCALWEITNKITFAD